MFNKIVGEAHSGGFELSFAAFLEGAPDVSAFAKNYLAVGFKLDYVKADGDLSNYTPDFIVRTTDGTVWIVETKGREEIDVPAEDGAPASMVRRRHSRKRGRRRRRHTDSPSLIRRASSGIHQKRWPDSPPPSQSINPDHE